MYVYTVMRLSGTFYQDDELVEICETEMAARQYIEERGLRNYCIELWRVIKEK